MDIADKLNRADAQKALENCCAARRWVDGMLARRPFADGEAVIDASYDVFEHELTDGDWLEAFAAHPMIGDIEILRAKYAATKSLAVGEQSGVAGAHEATLQELAELNRDYFKRFGFIFIVCATGKSAEQMLAILRTRIGNCRDEEIQNAAEEQMKITELRLRKLAGPTENS
jgi:OHCU decarboxylase